MLVSADQTVRQTGLSGTGSCLGTAADESLHRPRAASALLRAAESDYERVAGVPARGPFRATRRAPWGKAERRGDSGVFYAGGRTAGSGAPESPGSSPCRDLPTSWRTGCAGATDNTKIVRAPIRASNVKAFAERFVRSIPSECRDRLIFVGRRCAGPTGDACRGSY
jgi:hypothetical protein